MLRKICALELMPSSITWMRLPIMFDRRHANSTMEPKRWWIWLMTRVTTPLWLALCSEGGLYMRLVPLPAPVKLIGTPAPSLTVI